MAKLCCGSKWFWLDQFLSTMSMNTHTCVVYSLSGAKPDNVVGISCAPYGNSKQIETINSHKLIFFGSNRQFAWKPHFIKYFYQLLNESDCIIFSTSLSTEPRKMTQFAIRKTVNNRKLATRSFPSPSSDLKRLLHRKILPVLFTLW